MASNYSIDEEGAQVDETQDDESNRDSEVIHSGPSQTMVDDSTAEVDGEEPLNEDIVESILSDFDGIKKLRLSSGIHSLQSVVWIEFKNHWK